MIEFANFETKSLARSMWETVFGDDDEYLNLVFSKKYKDENTLIYFEEDKAVASMQMHPYTIRFYGKPIIFYYLAGLCTLPEYRNKGYMGQLILKSFDIMSERRIPLSILIPAEEWLFGYYKKYGFTRTFRKGNEAINLGSIISKYPKIEDAFQVFDKQYQQNDFTVLKTKSDFEAIIEENKLFNYPLKYNLEGMSRIIDPLPLLNLYAYENSSLNFTISVKDENLKTHFIYHIHNGIAELAQSKNSDIDINQKSLTKLLFGYEIDNERPEIRTLFQKKDPTMNLMFE